MRTHLMSGLVVLASLALGTLGAFAQNKHDTNPGGADFTLCGADGKCSVQKRGRTGNCKLDDGFITMRGNGRVTWKATVSSTGSSDSYCTKLFFYDRNNLKLFEFPRICSQRLSFVPQTWSRQDLAIPTHLFPGIVRVARADHC